MSLEIPASSTQSAASLLHADQTANSSLKPLSASQSCATCEQVALLNECTKQYLTFDPGFGSYVARYVCGDGHAFYKYHGTPSETNFPETMGHPLN